MRVSLHTQQNIVLLAFVLLTLSFLQPVGKPDTAADTLGVSQAAPEAALPAVPDIPERATLVFGGDVMLARTVEQKMLKLGDFAAPFRDIADVFKTADLSFANLESPLFDGGSATPQGGFAFRAPPRSIEGLVFTGLDAVSLANNHLMNQGAVGLRFTTNYLKEHGIAFAGAGQDFDEAHKGAVLAAGPRIVGVLAYAYPVDATVATASRPGIATMDIAQMQKDVERLKHSVDLVVVSMHAGTEYAFRSGEKQQAFARAAIDAGAAMVIGHHPHVIQELERYKDGLIFYSLGNLVFDQMWSVPTTEGMVVRVTLTDAKPSRVDFLPVKIEDYHRPRFMSEEEGRHLLETIGVEGFTLSLSS